MKLDVTQLLGRGDRAAFPRAIFPVWISQSLGRRPADNVNVETYDLKNQLGGEQLKGEAASEERGLQIHAHTHQSTKDKKKPQKTTQGKLKLLLNIKRKGCIICMIQPEFLVRAWRRVSLVIWGTRLKFGKFESISFCLMDF